MGYDYCQPQALRMNCVECVCGGHGLTDEDIKRELKKREDKQVSKEDEHWDYQQCDEGYRIINPDGDDTGFVANNEDFASFVVNEANAHLQYRYLLKQAKDALYSGTRD